MISDRFKNKLQTGEVLYGVISPTTDPTVCEYLGLAGLDFYMIDGEHGPITVSDAVGMIRACESAGIAPWARIRDIDEKLILQYLDAGVTAVMMPGIARIEQVERLVNAIKYPPIGKRGLGPVRASDYMAGAKKQLEYIQYANETILIFPQMEDIACMDILEDILKMDSINGIIVGPRDLAMSMGFYDGPGHQEVQSVIDTVFRKTIEAGKVVGSVAGNKEQAAVLIGKGAKIILNSVQGLLTHAVAQFKS